MIAFLLKYKLFQIPLLLVERLLALIIILPIPIYANLLYIFIKSATGYLGYYIRSIYYSVKAKKWGGNVIIDEDVILGNVKNYEFGEFSMIDKKVIICADSIKIGTGCHIAMGTIISKGGDVILEDFSAVSYGSILVAATDNTNGGFRIGPMVPEYQRNVLKGKIVLEKDSLVASNVVVLPNTVIGEGTVISPNSVINKSIKSWKIRLLDVRKVYFEREKIKFPDPEY